MLCLEYYFTKGKLSNENSKIIRRNALGSVLLKDCANIQARLGSVLTACISPATSGIVFTLFLLSTFDFCFLLLPEIVFFLLSLGNRIWYIQELSTEFAYFQPLAVFCLYLPVGCNQVCLWYYC